MIKIITPTSSSLDTRWETQNKKKFTFLAGLLAAGVMTAVMLIIQITGITPRSLINLIADKVAAVTGGSLSEAVIQAIGSLGKELLYLGVIAGQIAFGGLLGFLFGLVNRGVLNRRGIWQNSFIMSTGTWLFFLIVAFPVLDVGVFGSSLRDDQLYVLISTFLLFQLFGLLFAESFLLLVPPVGVRTASRNKKGQLDNPHSALIELPDELLAAETQSRWQAGRTSRRGFIGILGAVSLVVTAAIVIPGYSSRRRPLPSKTE